jgi:serine/threonine protein kinase
MTDDLQESLARSYSVDGDEAFFRSAVASASGQIAPRSVALGPGAELLGRFRIQRVAGRGGMGVVFRALDLTTGAREEPVAVKVLMTNAVAQRDRFAREAFVLKELSHRGIVRYLAHGTTDDGLAVLAMEWLDGEDLAQRLARGGLGLEESLKLVREVCEALVDAHRRGFVHRDIKPSNLFVVGGDPGCVKVLDFGIARLMGEPGLTHTGTFLGTVGYLAPEQALAAPHIDSRADVFAIGCVLYECVTGQAAFVGKQPAMVLNRLLREEPRRPSELCPAVSPELEALLGRLLAKQPRDRPGDAAEVLEALRDVSS